jgi:LysR family hydrogen peroxide-inducible transcriptional activator
VRQAIERTPQMPLMLQENFTVKLLEMLRTGEIDCAILAEPFPDTGLAMAPLYDEPFMAAVPSTTRWPSARKPSRRRAQERDHAAAGHRPLLSRPCAGGLPRVRALCQQRRGHPQEFEGSSLETIKHMVAAGMGVTLVPRLSVPRDALLTVSRRRKSDETYIRYLPIREEDGSPPPTRRVVLAWRRSFTRYEAIAALRNAIYACELPGVTRLS